MLLRTILISLGMVVGITIECSAKSYKDSILAWQHHYKQEFVEDTRSPVKAADTGFIRFFEVNKQWRVLAKVRLTPEAKPFNMATHSGKTKRFRQFALLEFYNPVTRGLRVHSLQAYERVDAPSGDSISRRSLFIPFNDNTNGEETYGGGRYIDLPKAAVRQGNLILDFNKAYNPYCAFGEGFSCPIPPTENRLDTWIYAGERRWARPEKD